MYFIASLKNLFYKLGLIINSILQLLGKIQVCLSTISSVILNELHNLISWNSYTIEQDKKEDSIECHKRIKLWDGIIKIITLQQFFCGCFCRISTHHVRIDGLNSWTYSIWQAEPTTHVNHSLGVIDSGMSSKLTWRQ